MGLIPGLGRPSGGGNGNPLQYSCLENPWTEEPGGLQSMGLQSDMTEHLNAPHTHGETKPQKSRSDLYMDKPLHST